MAAAKIVFLAFVAVTTVAGESCVEKSRGMLAGIRHETQVHILPGGQYRYEIEIPSPCKLLTSGLHIQVCDPNSSQPGLPPPVLQLPSLHHASVLRPSYGYLPAMLTATVYCLVGRAAPQAQPRQEWPQAQPQQEWPQAQPQQEWPQAQPQQEWPQAQPQQEWPQAQPQQEWPQAQPQQEWPQAQPQQEWPQAQPQQEWGQAY